jgi:hypothetical protein
MEIFILLFWTHPAANKENNKEIGPRRANKKIL